MTTSNKDRSSNFVSTIDTHRTTDSRIAPTASNTQPATAVPLLSPVSNADSGFMASNGDSTGVKLGGLSRARQPNCETKHEERLAMVVEVLTHLKNFWLIRKVTEAYFPLAATQNVPSGLIHPALESLSKFVERYNLENIDSSTTRPLKEVAESILRATAAPIPITSTLQTHEFLAMYTEPQIRLEYLGILFSVGSRGHLVSLIGEARHGYMRDTFRCCTICLQLSRELSPINDAMVWLSLDTMILCSNIYGDLSKL